MGLVVASKRKRPANMGRWLIEAPRQVRTSNREEGSMLIGRLVEASGLLKIFSLVRAAKLHMRGGRSSRMNGKMSSMVRLAEVSRLLVIFSVVRAASLPMRRGRSSQMNGKMSSVVGLLNIYSVVRAAKLHRPWRSPQMNWKMSSVVRLVEVSRLLMVFSVVRAAKLHMR